MGDSPEFLIDGILPANEVHLIGGASGSGKTTFTFQMLADWQEGKPIFGHESHPVPYAYVSIDRSRASVTRTLERLSLTDTIVNLVAQEDLPDAASLAQVLSVVAQMFPEAKLIIIEGFQLLAGDGTGKYNSVARLLTKTTKICTEHKLTILGVCHSPKLKIDENFKHPRELVLGSVAWGAYSDTVIHLDHVEATGDIAIRVMPRNAANEQHNFVFGVQGKLVPLDAAKPREALRLRIEALSAGCSLTRQEVLEWTESYGASLRTGERVLTECLRNKVLENIGVGIYERTTQVPLRAVEEFNVEM